LEINAMAEHSIELQATARPRVGKGAARQARREGKVPAVIYGDNKEPETIALDYHELWKQVLKGHFTSTVFEIQVEGKKHLVIPRDLQVDPVKDLPIHVDFLRIGEEGLISVEVPVRFVNDTQSPGLKRGGVLNIVRHEIEVTCPYDKIPTFFEVDLTGLEIGRAIHISAVKLPEGVTPAIKDRDFTIATIAGAVKQAEEPAAVAAPAEGAAAAGAGGDAAKGAGGKAGDAKAGDAKAGGEKKK
jgi:large subunit ribosomal protein L25